MSRSPASPAGDSGDRRGSGKKLSANGLLVIAAIIIVYLILRARQTSELPGPPADKGQAIGARATPDTDEAPEPAKTTSASPRTAKPSGGSDTDGGVATATTPERPAATTRSPPTTRPVPSPVIVKNVTIRDLGGRVVYQGNVDLTDTLARIDRGQRLSFPNDGSVFRNRERQLPGRDDGYYREWVHPTPKLSGPGPQRVVTGRQGEAYYTHDHYSTFKKVR